MQGSGMRRENEGRDMEDEKKDEKSMQKMKNSIARREEGRERR